MELSITAHLDNSYQNLNLTKLEVIVAKKVAETCYDEYCTNVPELSIDLDMNQETVKGVIGSLTKKGLVQCESDQGLKQNQIFFCMPDGLVSYGCDNYNWK